MDSGYFYFHTNCIPIMIFLNFWKITDLNRSSHPDVFLGKSILKICSKFTGEHSCRSEISIKLQRNFIEITLRHGCSFLTLLHIFRTSFLENTSGKLLLPKIGWLKATKFIEIAEWELFQVNNLRFFEASEKLILYVGLAIVAKHISLDVCGSLSSTKK